jgi:hypothetical protein
MALTQVRGVTGCTQIGGLINLGELACEKA